MVFQSIMAEVGRLSGLQLALLKPFDLETLSAAVGNELERVRASQTLRRAKLI
jgi:hypothetical protein